MSVKRMALIALPLVVSAAPSAAQDIAPVVTPGAVAEGLFLRSRMEAQAKSLREKQGANRAAPKPGTAAFQKRACDNRPRFRKQHGATHPKVMQLEALCKQAGY